MAGSLLCFALAAQPKFDGGMMVHTGYLAATLPARNHEASGVPFGIGGTMRFHVGSLLRVGGESFMLADPHIGLEYALTERIHLTSRLSYPTPLKRVDVPTGPRVFLGFVFAH